LDALESAEALNQEVFEGLPQKTTRALAEEEIVAEHDHRGAKQPEDRAVL
jgi:hypothetical protein